MRKLKLRSLLLKYGQINDEDLTEEDYKEKINLEHQKN